MLVLVTGVAGFLGSTLADALRSRGHRVRGVERFNAYYEPAFKPALHIEPRTLRVAVSVARNA